jgi:hypothetical protein
MGLCSRKKNKTAWVWASPLCGTKNSNPRVIPALKKEEKMDIYLKKSMRHAIGGGFIRTIELKGITPKGVTLTMATDDIPRYYQLERISATKGWLRREINQSVAGTLWSIHENEFVIAFNKAITNERAAKAAREKASYNRDKNLV